MTWATDDGQSGIETPFDGVARLKAALEDDETIIIGAETAFDVFVACAAALGNPDNWIELWDEAYRQGRVKDVLVRKRLLDLAAGRFKYDHLSGPVTKTKHDLAGAAFETCGIRLDKSSDTWRLRYSELDGVPFAEWPQEAIDYAMRDAEVTGMVYEAQENWREHPHYKHIPALWFGKVILPQGTPCDPLEDEYFQTYHALWLKAMAGQGVMIDADAFAQYENRVARKYAELTYTVRSHGLLRREYWRDLPKLREQKSEFATRGLWADFRAALDVDDPEALEAWRELKTDGLVRWSYHKNEAPAKQRVVDVFTRAGRALPHTKTWKPELHGEFEKISLDADTCRIGGLLEVELDLPEQKLQAYADLVHASKVINTDLPKIKGGIDRPIHTHFTVMVENGRTSSSNPPLQNRDRGEDAQAGDRECFIPTRPGYVYIDLDYPQLELHTFAQLCKWVLGYSTMGDAILAGKNLHVVVGGQIAGVSNYDEAFARWKAGDLGKEYMAAKALNFGVIGGLGANTMVSYAAKSYGVYLPVERWKAHIETWKDALPEASEYFAYIESCESYPGSGNFLVPQTQSGRLRAGATYTAACNSGYSGLGSDVAKRAGLYLWRASYVRGVDPVLFGSGAGIHSSQARPGNFIHDQFLVEAREDCALEQLPRIEHWCREAARDLLPDYGEAMAVKTEALIARRWSKKAERIEDADGNIGIWEDARLFAQAAS
jgi:hypothetical protein